MVAESIHGPGPTQFWATTISFHVFGDFYSSASATVAPSCLTMVAGTLYNSYSYLSAPSHSQMVTSPPSHSVAWLLLLPLISPWQLVLPLAYPWLVATTSDSRAQSVPNDSLAPQLDCFEYGLAFLYSSLFHLLWRTHGTYNTHCRGKCSFITQSSSGQVQQSVEWVYHRNFFIVPFEH